MENEQVEQVERETIKMEEKSRLEVIVAVITVGVLGFWFGVGAALGAKVVNNLEEQNQVEPQQVTTRNHNE